MTIALVDANYYLKRAANEPRLKEIEIQGYGSIGGVHGFLGSLQHSLEVMQASYCACIWDGGYSDRRLGLFPDYKQSRRDKVATPEGLASKHAFKTQVKLLFPLLKCLGVHNLQLFGKEGDDIIAQCVSMLKGITNQRIVVMSEDKDMLQLVSKGVVVYRPRSQVIVATNNFESVTGVPQKHYLLFRAMVGEPGRNNIDGVPGVGTKTAHGLISHPDVEDFIDIVDLCYHGKRKWEQNMIDSFEIVCRNLELLDIEAEQFSEEHVEKIRRSLVSTSPHVNQNAVISSCKKLEIQQVMNNFSTWIGTFKRLDNALI